MDWWRRLVTNTRIKYINNLPYILHCTETCTRYTYIPTSSECYENKQPLRRAGCIQLLVYASLSYQFQSFRVKMREKWGKKGKRNG